MLSLYIFSILQCRNKPSFAYALKCLKKQHIVETQQQARILTRIRVEASVFQWGQHVELSYLSDR